MGDETEKGGGWAVAYRVKATQEGQFHDDAQDVDEATARKVFGRCIRAGEMGLQVEGVEIDAVRLLRGDLWKYPSGWGTVQQHDVGVAERWKTMADPLPYHESQGLPLGVPCMPGAWCSDSSCAMHWGLPLDENGLCVEGRRAVKVLDLFVVPKSMQEKWRLPATMTFEEAEELRAILEGF